MKTTGIISVFICSTILAGWGQSAGAQEPATAVCEAKQKSGGEAEQSRFFAAPLPVVKQALTSALRDLEFEIDKDKADVIEAHRPHHIGAVVGSGGEKMALHFKEAEQDGKKGVQVTGQTVKTMVGRMGQKAWTGAVMDQTSCNLAKSL